MVAQLKYVRSAHISALKNSVIDKYLCYWEKSSLGKAVTEVTCEQVEGKEIRKLSCILIRIGEFMSNVWNDVHHHYFYIPNKSMYFCNRLLKF